MEQPTPGEKAWQEYQDFLLMQRLQRLAYLPQPPQRRGGGFLEAVAWVLAIAAAGALLLTMLGYDLRALLHQPSATAQATAAPTAAVTQPTPRPVVQQPPAPAPVVVVQPAPPQPTAAPAPTATPRPGGIGWQGGVQVDSSGISVQGGFTVANEPPPATFEPTAFVAQFQAPPPNNAFVGCLPGRNCSPAPTAAAQATADAFKAEFQ